MSSVSKHGSLPADVEHLKATRVFTPESVPAGLLRDHATKKGVWGKIVAVEGSLQLTFNENADNPIDVSVGEYAIVAPEELHYVHLADDTKFKVEFYRAP